MRFEGKVFRDGRFWLAEIPLLDAVTLGRRMDFDTAAPDAIASAIADEIGREVHYREVETDGARRAAEKLAELF